DRGRVGAVVGLVGGADRGGHVALVDRGGGARARAGQLVVGLVGAVEGDVGGDRLARAGGGRAVLGVARVASDHVRGDDPVARSLHDALPIFDRGRVGAVVGLVGGADRGGHGALVDRGGGARARAGQLVVGLVGAVEGDVGGDRLARAGGGRAELGVARVAADHVRGDDPVAGGLRLERAAVDRGRVGTGVAHVGTPARIRHRMLVYRG